MELEEKLMKQLSEVSCLDTRDIGSARPTGKLNIFIKEDNTVNQNKMLLK